MIGAKGLDERSNEVLYGSLYREFEMGVNLEESSSRISLGR